MAHEIPRSNFGLVQKLLSGQTHTHTHTHTHTLKKTDCFTLIIKAKIHKAMPLTHGVDAADYVCDIYSNVVKNGTEIFGANF